MKKADMAEELERLRSQLDEYIEDDEPSPDPNGYYVPTAIHIAMPPEHGLGNADNFRHYCGFEKEGSWVAEWMDDKKARTLPTCPECIELWERANDREWIPISERQVKEPPISTPVIDDSNTATVTKVVVSDYRM